MHLLWRTIGQQSSVQISLSLLRGPKAFPIHSHDFPEIFWILDGSGIHRLNGSEERIAAGSLAVLRPADRHGFGAAPGGIEDDLQFVDWLIREIGVAAIPASPFYQESDKSMGRFLARFAVCKKDETLDAAAERLFRLAKA